MNMDSLSRIPQRRHARDVSEFRLRFAVAPLALAGFGFRPLLGQVQHEADARSRHSGGVRSNQRTRPETIPLGLVVKKAAIHVPIVFMTGHGDIPMSVKAMKAGAADFLTKPFRQQEMLDAVTAAIERDRKRREDEKIVSNARALFETLTPREREILALVSAGLMNKQIAAEIGIAEITVKIHRAHIMKKMGTRSLADLVRITEMLGIRRRRAVAQ